MEPIGIVRIIARLNIGGPAVHVVDLVESLDAKAFPSELIIGRPGPGEGDMAYLAQQAQIKPIVIGSLGPTLSPLRDLWTVLRIYRVLRRLRPQIVETHTAKAGAVGRLAAWLARVPVIIHIFHGHVFHSYFGPRKTRLFLAIERFLARRSTCIVTVSESQRRQIVETYAVCSADKVRVIPYGLNLLPFVQAGEERPSPATAVKTGELRSALKLKPEARLIGMVGRLDKIKNPILALQVAEAVLARYDDAHFCFLGDGVLRSELEQRVKEAPARQRIHFSGWRRDVPACMAQLDCLLLTSRNEGTPLSVIEAMAAGTPVVATDVGGVCDVVEHGVTGLLAPTDDAEALTVCVRRILDDPAQAQQLAQAGQAFVVERFQRERLAGDMTSLYRQLVRQRSATG